MNMTFGTCMRTQETLELTKMSPEARGLLRLAGFLTWFLAGLPLFVQLVHVPSLLQQPRYLLWLACFSIFGITFGLTPWNDRPRWPHRLQMASLAAQTITALVMIILVCSGKEGALLVIVSAQLGWFMSLRRAVRWPLRVTLSIMATYLGFQVLALFSCFLAASETSARAKLARANSELRATGELLANTSRLAERERISRELHDTLGHHLTALSLNLDAANQLAQDK